MAVRGDLLQHSDNHVLILLDGRPLKESYSGGINFSIYLSFPLDIIDRIEFIRGPGSVLYGTNAFSGVINIISKKVDKNSFQFKVGSGAYATKDVSGTGTYKKDNISLLFGAKFFQEDGWKFEAIDQSNKLGNFDAGENNYSGFLKGEIYGLKIEALFTRSEQDFLGSSVASYPSASFPYNLDRTVENERSFINIGKEIKYSEKLNYDLNITYNGMVFDHYAYKSLGKDILFESTAFYSPTDKTNLIFGGTYNYQDIDSKTRRDDRDDPVDQHTSYLFGLYSQFDYKFNNNYKLILGGQFNKPKDIGLDFVGRLGLIGNFDNGVGFKALYSEAFRSAFGTEKKFSLILRRPEGHASEGSIYAGLLGNPLLKPEKVNTSELQLFYNKEKFNVAGTIYHSKQTDLITRERNILDFDPDLVETPPFVFLNKGVMKSNGFEIESKIIPSSKLYILGSLSYQSNKNILKDVGSKDIKNFTMLPNLMAKYGFSYRFNESISLGIFNNSVGKGNEFKSSNSDGTKIAVNPEAGFYNLLTSNLNINLNKLLNLNTSEYKMNLNLYGYNLLDENIYHPEFAGKKINTIPSRSGRSFYMKFTFGF